MAEERAQRRLAAILAAGAVDCGRLMEQDEAGTPATYEVRCRGVLEPRVGRHWGRIFEVTSNSLFVEVVSAIKTMQCVIDLPEGMAAAIGDTPGSCHNSCASASIRTT